MAFKDRCAEQLGDIPSADVAWDIFVADHMSTIRASARTVNFTGETESVYRFRPVQFADSVGVSPGMVPIFLALNGFDGADQLSGSRQLLMPDPTTITALVRQFASVRRARRSLSDMLSA